MGPPHDRSGISRWETGLVRALRRWTERQCPRAFRFGYPGTRTRRLPLYPGPGCGGSRLSRDTQTSLSPDTSSSSSGGSPRRSQASRET
ncbi:hypothetical protein ATANTOWER_011385 [Ataeniobius toweri]|uniref:Uncharacterized protein n=1 Tax=Ataeniobius toweri TaxID=208326 RepID=A0ABU7B7D0_9TELE|nr:hypothetical protein [Ataeniobius toweri]